MFVFNNDEKSYHLLALWLFGFPDFFIFFFYITTYMLDLSVNRNAFLLAEVCNK